MSPAWKPTVYHFRVVATNSFGTTTSADQTFSFYPETLPERDRARADGLRWPAGLPRLRARLAPRRRGGQPDDRRAELALRRRRRGSPSTAFRLGSGARGIPQNVFGDHYVASRTAAGWTTSYVGIPADQRAQSGGPPNGGVVTVWDLTQTRSDLGIVDDGSLPHLG